MLHGHTVIQNQPAKELENCHSNGCLGDYGGHRCDAYASTSSYYPQGKYHRYPYFASEKQRLKELSTLHGIYRFCKIPESSLVIKKSFLEDDIVGAGMDPVFSLRETPRVHSR